MPQFWRKKVQQKFASDYAGLQNHFNSERHVVDRHTHKLRRSAAPTERQAPVG